MIFITGRAIKHKMVGFAWIHLDSLGFTEVSGGGLVKEFSRTSRAESETGVPVRGRHLTG